MKKFFNKFINKNSYLYKITKNIVIFFVAFNLIIFPSVIIEQSIGKPNATAKAYMSAALITNFEFIIFPSKIFGFNNPITKFFYPVRNFLYFKGYELLPKNDAEKDLWWARIRFNEWYHIYEEILIKYQGNVVTEKQANSDNLLKWLDEIYSHLEPMSKLPIEDPKFREIRFRIYNDVSWQYTRSKISLTGKMYYPINSKEFPYNHPVINNNKEIEKYKKILDNYLELKNTNDESINEYLKSKDWWGEPILVNLITKFTVANEVVNNKLNCNDKYLNLFIDSKEQLFNKALNDSRISDYTKYRINKDLSSDLDTFIKNSIKTKCDKEIK